MPENMPEFVHLQLSNCNVWLKKSIKWDDQKRINAPLYAGTKIKLDPVTNQPESVEASADVWEKMKEQEVLVLLHRVEREGKDLPVNLQTLGSLDIEDYNLLLEEAEKIFADIKKKSSKTQTLSVTQSN